MSILPPLAAALAPLLIAPGLLFYFDVTPKVALLMLAVALALIPGMNCAPELWRRREGRWFTVLLAGQLACLAVATAFSTNPALSAGGSNWRRLGMVTHAGLVLFALIAAAYLSRSPERLRVWLRLFCAAGLLAAVYGCCQYAGWDPWLPAARYHVGEGEAMIVRPPSTLGHASYAATFYLHTIFAAIALIVCESGRWKYAGWLAAILCCIALILSGTRAAIVGLVVGLVLLTFVTRPAVRVRHLALGLAILIASAAFYASPLGQKLRGRTRWSSEDLLGGARLWLWRDAVTMGADRWFTGWGPEVFPAEFPRYQSRELARAFPDSYHESPHNIFLEAWTERGFAGVLVLFALAAIGFQALRRSPVEKALGAGLGAAVAAQQFTSFTLVTALCFYFTIAVLVGLTPPARALAAARFPWLLAPVAGAAAWYAMALLVSDHFLRVADRQFSAGQIQQGEIAYGQALWWAPPGVSSDLWYSRKLVETAERSRLVLHGAAALRMAEEAAKQATLSAEDRHNAFYNLAAIQAARNDAAGVEHSLRRAIEVAPNWFKPHWALAKLLALSGRRQEAETEAERALDLDGGKHAEVRDTWQAIRSQR